MKSFSRSSRATGPKIRVPRISPFALSNTIALSSNRMYEPSGRRTAFLVRTTTPLDTAPFLMPPFGAACFTRHHDGVADARISPACTAQHPDAKDFLCAAVVSHFHAGFLLYHLLIPFSFIAVQGNHFARSTTSTKRQHFAFAQWSRFHDAYRIADVASVCLIVSHELASLFDELPVLHVLLLSLYSNNDALGHGIRRHYADTLFSQIAIRLMLSFQYS